jgi:hypothetical protein
MKTNRLALYRFSVLKQMRVILLYFRLKSPTPVYFDLIFQHFVCFFYEMYFP